MSAYILFENAKNESPLSNINIFSTEIFTTILNREDMGSVTVQAPPIISSTSKDKVVLTYDHFLF